MADDERGRARDWLALVSLLRDWLQKSPYGTTLTGPANRCTSCSQNATEV
jgi:hypothetical protein